MIVCWKCKKIVSEEPVKIGFRASCPHCSSDLHVCVNCRYYSPGKPNDCSVPGTDYVRDREASNLCEEFKLKTSEPPRSSSTKPLFSDDSPPKKRDFKSLFKDEEET